MIDLSNTIGLIGRFRPLHLGSALMLVGICEHARKVKIGIGSSNKYDFRNPFTPQETSEAIDVFLKSKFSNYEILFIPDFAHIPEYQDGKKWKECTIELFGDLDTFVTANPYVRKLLQDTYPILHPTFFIPKSKQIAVRGSIVRVAMAMGAGYRDLMPGIVADYYENNKLIFRFQREFGLATLTLLDNERWLRDQTLEDEEGNVRENRVP